MLHGLSLSTGLVQSILVVHLKRALQTIFQFLFQKKDIDIIFELQKHLSLMIGIY